VGYKAILVHPEPTQEAVDRLACAANLADRFGALLIGCGSEAETVLVDHPFAVHSPEVLAVRTRQVNDNIEAARLAFEKASHNRPHNWVSERLPPTEALALHGRAADLIVTNTTPKERFNPSRHVDAGLLVAIAGRPVLVAPKGDDHLRGERILVCWKDTREARRAISDALPFLQMAEDVLVVEVAAPDAIKDAGRRIGEVAEALCRHGVFAHSEVLVRDQRKTVSILEDRACALGADLIVAGGYGRSRMGEWAFGGVTESLLRQSGRFVLLSH